MISRTVHARPNCETRLSRVIKEHRHFFFSGATFSPREPRWLLPLHITLLGLVISAYPRLPRAWLWQPGKLINPRGKYYSLAEKLTSSETRKISAVGAMSDEIIHLEEVIRERIRFGTREPPKVFSENCFERCFPVASKRRPELPVGKLENLEMEFTGWRAKLGNFRDFVRNARLRRSWTLTSPSMRLLPSRHRKCAGEEACISRRVFRQMVTRSSFPRAN